MKFKHHIITASILTASLFSCSKDYLDVKEKNADVPLEQMYSTYSYVQNVVWNIYSYLPDGYDQLGREAASDNAEMTNEGSNYQKFNIGTWNQFDNPDGVWSSYFTGIRQANLFLQNYSKINISNIKNGIVGGDSTAYYNARDNVKFMKGEALGLKAFFYFELVKRYGGVPIMDEPLDYDNPDTWKNLQRNSLDECLKYIVNLCDQAAGIIPWNLTPYSWYVGGRITNATVLALKARTILYGASPLYKDAGSTYTWEDAAKAASDVIKINTSVPKFSLVAKASYANLFGSAAHTQTEAIFAKRYASINTLEKNNYPIAYAGSNGNSITPTQNLVDAFDVITGTTSVPFDWNNPTHANAPYANRDVRFAASIAYNGMTFNSVVLQTYTGGTSGLPNTNATKTGYYLKKWINSGLNLVNDAKSNHAFVYFRYAEILLNYAEAMYNAYGATGDPQGYGKTALSAFNDVHARAGLGNITAAELTQTKIENECRVEFCFEDHRFWDVRRWKKGETYFSIPVNKVVITNTGTTAAPVYAFEVKKLEDRVFDAKMYWYPIPQTEISKTGWTQNPLW
jgi:starch-binding outer membrane protein, SusD/RagB family